jgi:hypothetical protein
MRDGHAFMRFSKLGAEPPVIEWPCTADKAQPGPHDPEKALRRCRARADDRGAVPDGLEARSTAQNSGDTILNSGVESGSATCLRERAIHCGRGEEALLNLPAWKARVQTEGEFLDGYGVPGILRNFRWVR